MYSRNKQSSEGTNSFITLFTLIGILATTCGCSCTFQNPIAPILVTPYPEADFSPAWSPDGSMVAFFSFIDSSGASQPGIYLVDADGTGKRFTGISGLNVQWMPGDSVLVVNSGAGLVTFNIETHATRVLGIGTWTPPFSVSADGKYIYYDGPPITGDWSSGIYRYEFATDSITPLVDGTRPSVSPDGNKIAFGFDGLRVYDMATKTSIQIANRPFSLAKWFASSHEILCHDNTGRLYRSDLSSPPVYFAPGMGPLAASPDGMKVLFTGNTPGPDSLRHLWSVQSDGTGLKQFTF